MKITFVLNSIGANGGCRAVFECANRLLGRGHDVSVVYPALPLRITHGRGISGAIRNMNRDARDTLRNLARGKKAGWFPLKARLIRVPTLDPDWIRFFADKIPDADAVVATAWETAYAVCRLSAAKGKKFYFVQHYEVWDLWESKECWDEARRVAPGGRDNVLLAMAGIDPPGNSLKRSKELVDASYRLPLKKITTSSQLRQLLEERFGGDVEQVVLGVNRDHFHPERPGSDVPRRGKTVAMPYRRYAWKGEADGVRALELVRAMDPETRFILYGVKDKYVPGWLRASNRGPVYGADLRRLYNEADVFVFTSWVEGWALPPMEAMACGTACVTTNVGAVMDYALPGRTAVVVKPRSPEEVAGAVLSLLGDRDKMAGIAREGYEQMTRFSWDRTAREMERALTT